MKCNNVFYKGFRPVKELCTLDTRLTVLGKHITLVLWKRDSLLQIGMSYDEAITLRKELTRSIIAAEQAGFVNEEN